MMSTMARLPYKQTSPTQQPPPPPPPSRVVDNFDGAPIRGGGGGGYWDMQPRHHPALPYIRNNQRLPVEIAGKRKSAVELLQETKAFYVKSETVLDRKQELRNSGHLHVSHQLTAPGVPARLLRKCGNPHGCCTPVVTTTSQQQQQQQQQAAPLPTSSSNNQQQSSCCWPPGNSLNHDRPDGILSPQRASLPPPALPPKSPRLVVAAPQRRATSGPPTGVSGNDQLQAKLRRLINTDSKENIFFPDSPTSVEPIGGGGGDAAAASSSPQDDNDDDYVRGSPSPAHSKGERSSSRDVRFKFGRSNSQSHGCTAEKKSCKGATAGGGGESSSGCHHKSLPDLHTSSRHQQHHRSPVSPNASSMKLKPFASSQQQQQQQQQRQLATGNSNYRADCETSSDYSDRISFKRDSVCYRSSESGKFSHGATARDSGGSSGHYTHNSEPPPPTKIQDCWSHAQRDSGASSDDDQAYSPTNLRCPEEWSEGRSRPILRSKSDISDRYWRAGGNNPVRPPLSISQLEAFFDCLGLDRDNFRQITNVGGGGGEHSRTSSPVYFDSVSSVDSTPGQQAYAHGNHSGGQWQNNNSSEGNDENSQSRVSDPLSIVERNARIVKWLFQCRKVQLEFS